jgi:hypothetical protein
MAARKKTFTEYIYHTCIIPVAVIEKDNETPANEA